MFSSRKAGRLKKEAEEATQKFLAEKFIKEAEEAAAEAEKEVILALRSAEAAQNAADCATRAEGHAKNAENCSEKAFAASSVTEVVFRNSLKSLTSQEAERFAEREAKDELDQAAVEQASDKALQEKQDRSSFEGNGTVKLHTLEDSKEVKGEEVSKQETQRTGEDGVNFHQSTSSSSSTTSTTQADNGEQKERIQDGIVEAVRVVLPDDFETKEESQPHAADKEENIGNTQASTEASGEIKTHGKTTEGSDDNIPQQKQEVELVKQDISLSKQEQQDDAHKIKEDERAESLKVGGNEDQDKIESADKQKDGIEGLESVSATKDKKDKDSAHERAVSLEQAQHSLVDEREEINQLLHGQAVEKGKAEKEPQDEPQALKSDESSWAQQEEVRREQEEKVKREEEAEVKAKAEEELQKQQEIQRKEKEDKERQQQQSTISSPAPSQGPMPVAVNSRSGRRPPPPPPKPGSMTSPTPKSPEPSSSFLVSPTGPLAFSPSSPETPSTTSSTLFERTGNSDKSVISQPLFSESASEVTNEKADHANTALTSSSVVSGLLEKVSDAAHSITGAIYDKTDKVTTAIASTNNDLTNSAENSEASSSSSTSSSKTTTTDINNDQPTNTKADLSSNIEQPDTAVQRDSPNSTTTNGSSVPKTSDVSIAFAEGQETKAEDAPSNSHDHSSLPVTEQQQHAAPEDSKSMVAHSNGSLNPLSAFEVLKVVGKGRFAKVVLVRRLSDDVKFAVKIMEKAFLIQQNQVANVMSERRVLEQLRHPFLMSLCFAFETTDKLYLGLEFVEGGELFFHGQQQPKRRFSEEVVRLWAAELTLALGHLHSVNTVFRDLKPENVLLDLEGHVHLTDFGLAKDLGSVSGKTQTFCGAKEYLAPEVIQGLPYGFSVDWWTLGILIYELTVGLPPFFSRNTTEMYAKILHADLRFPPFLSPECVHLIRLLLERDPAQRLGSRKDVEELQAHPFFTQGRSGADVNKFWEDVYRKAIPSHFRPTENNNGHQQFQGEKVEDESGPPDDEADRSFIGFEYNQELF